MQIEIKEINPLEINWDSLVKTIPEGTIFQTTFWAKYLERYAKVRPVYLAAKGKDGSILGTLLMYQAFYFRRFLGIGIIGKLIFSIMNRVIPVATWRFGPLIYDKSNFDEILEKILTESMVIAKQKGFIFLRDISLPIHTDRENILRGHNKFLDLGFSFKETVTIILNLQKSVDELWKGLRNSARKAIKKINNLDIKVVTLRKDDLTAYYNLLKEARKRVGAQIHPTYPTIQMWEELGAKTGILEMFGVMKGDQLLGAISILTYNNIFFEASPAQSNYAFKNGIYVNDILKWHIIQQGNFLGRRLYDLNGIFVNPKNKKENSLNQFKEKWGGDRLLYYLYSKRL